MLDHQPHGQRVRAVEQVDRGARLRVGDQLGTRVAGAQRGVAGDGISGLPGNAPSARPDGVLGGERLGHPQERVVVRVGGQRRVDDVALAVFGDEVDGEDGAGHVVDLQLVVGMGDVERFAHEEVVFAAAAAPVDQEDAVDGLDGGADRRVQLAEGAVGERRRAGAGRAGRVAGQVVGPFQGDEPLEAAPAEALQAQVEGDGQQVPGGGEVDVGQVEGLAGGHEDVVDDQEVGHLLAGDAEQAAAQSPVEGVRAVAAQQAGLLRGPRAAFDVLAGGGVGGDRPDGVEVLEHDGELDGGRLAQRRAQGVAGGEGRGPGRRGRRRGRCLAGSFHAARVRQQQVGLRRGQVAGGGHVEGLVLVPRVAHEPDDPGVGSDLGGIRQAHDLGLHERVHQLEVGEDLLVDEVEGDLLRGTSARYQWSGRTRADSKPAADQ